MNLKELKEDVQKHGQHHKVIRDKRTGVILDGLKKHMALGDDAQEDLIDTKDNVEAFEILFGSMSPQLKGEEGRQWVREKFTACVNLGYEKAFCIEQLNLHTRYSRRALYMICASGNHEQNCTNKAQNRLNSENKGGNSAKRKPIEDLLMITIDQWKPQLKNVIQKKSTRWIKNIIRNVGVDDFTEFMEYLFPDTKNKLEDFKPPESRSAHFALSNRKSSEKICKDW